MEKTFCCRIGCFVKNDQAVKCLAWAGRSPDSPRTCGGCANSGIVDMDGNPVPQSRARASGMARVPTLDLWGL